MQSREVVGTLPRLFVERCRERNSFTTKLMANNDGVLLCHGGKFRLLQIIDLPTFGSSNHGCSKSDYLNSLFCLQHHGSNTGGCSLQWLWLEYCITSLEVKISSESSLQDVEKKFVAGILSSCF